LFPLQIERARTFYFFCRKGEQESVVSSAN
jgi:hypothetical protein